MTAPNQPDIRSAQFYVKYIQTFDVPFRILIAKSADLVQLRALCHEVNAQVIRHVIDHQHFGLDHARLLAQHHHTQFGLEYLTRKPAFANDNAVRAALFKNNGSSKLVLDRCFRTLNLFRLNNLAVGREANEKTMMYARDTLRTKFDQSTPDQKTQFIIRTEGRCLRFFYQMQLDAETADLLGKHMYSSFILVRNLLSFPGLPPEVLRGIFRSPIISKHQGFRQRILSHTNCPADVRIKAKQK
ncbi:hypothetical protein COT97_01850 [Candidatus Falkowbacteria bacterium CG10_big_fil_rev_8_21_14_0_10_39_11]|uniref:Uncharacterized protein n=1 Tax=Candidatus Falkowbacteria bacterium CG10_big_fil_rev_8_21_14_0_10_39_11 TaxID=1974565 RepID=A0A2H0V5G1_9BACT|nr:MAG: hypothetical protein COT97_01850 [Candidatus Falkowbacteria bacterium CG10_big_fil_rev_8_21_14_0_10_39_11]